MPPPPASALAEQELADLARGGDEWALGELYQRHAPQLHRHAWRMLRDEAAAGDVVQEAFLRAITAMPRTREKLRFRAWMFRIVTNLCLRELTQRGRLGSGPDPESLGAPAESGPEEQRARDEWAGHVAAALAQLPVRYRQILLLREVEGLDYDELGQALELSASMVKVTLHRARSRFRAHLVAEQLTGNRGLGAACPELAALVEAGQGHRLERHLESCPRCREDQPPVAALLAALPLPPVPLPPQPPPGWLAGARLTSRAGRASSSVGTWAAGLAAAVGVAGIVALATLGPGVFRRAANATRIAAPRADATVPPGAAAGLPVAPRPAVATSSARRAEKSRRRAGAPRSTTRRNQAPARRMARASLPRAPHDVRRARAASAAPPPSDAEPTELQATLLHVRLAFLPGTLLIERGGKALTARPREKLYAGDLLVTQGRPAVLAFPYDQWLAFSGRLRLLAPADPDAPSPARVVLVGGEARAKATRRGRGLTIAVEHHECLADEGELRVRVLGRRAIRVESLTATVRIRGLHAERVLPPASQIVMAAQPGFGQPLLAGPDALRPVQHRGPRPPVLSWEAVHGATGYRVLIGSEPNFWIPEESAVVGEPGYRPRSDRPGRHFWQVIPLQGSLEGYPSRVYAYYIDENLIDP